MCCFVLKTFVWELKWNYHFLRRRTMHPSLTALLSHSELEI